MIAAGCNDGTLKIFHLHSNNMKINVPITKAGSTATHPCTCLRWRPPQFSAKVKNVLVSGGTDGNIVHWHVTTGKELSRIEEPDNQIFCLDYNKNGTQFATAGKDCAIRVYDEETQQLTIELSGVGWKDAGHNNRVYAIKFIPDDPNIILTGGWDTNVHFWDMREKKSIRTILGPKISGDAIDFKNGKVLTGANRARQQLELWDYGSGEKIQDIDWEPGVKMENGAFVYGAQFSKTSDESLTAVSSGVNMMKIFDQQREYIPFGQVEGLKKGMYCVDYGNFSNKFACAGGDGALFVMALSTQ